MICNEIHTQRDHNQSVSIDAMGCAYVGQLSNNISKWHKTNNVVYLLISNK